MRVSCALRNVELMDRYRAPLLRKIGFGDAVNFGSAVRRVIGAGSCESVVQWHRVSVLTSS